MALRELPSSLRRMALRDARSTAAVAGRLCRRYASADATTPPEVSEDLQDLESQSSLSTPFSPDERIKAYNPIKRAQGRKRQLPPSRYVLDAVDILSQYLINVLVGININLQGTTEDLCIPINHPQNPILHLENSSPVHSPIPDSNKPTNPQSRQI
jgi:hypothetical protein